MWISNVLPPNKSNNELPEIVYAHDALGYVISSVCGDCAWIPLRPQWVLRFPKGSRGTQLGLINPLRNLIVGVAQVVLFRHLRFGV